MPNIFADIVEPQKEEIKTTNIFSDIVATPTSKPAATEPLPVEPSVYRPTNPITNFERDLSKIFWQPQLEVKEVAEQLKAEKGLPEVGFRGLTTNEDFLKEYEEIKPEWVDVLSDAFKRGKETGNYFSRNFAFEEESPERAWNIKNKVVGFLEDKGRAIQALALRGTALPLMKLFGTEENKREIEAHIATLEDLPLWVDVAGKTAAYQDYVARTYRAIQAYDKGNLAVVGNTLKESGADTAMTLVLLWLLGAEMGAPGAVGVGTMSKGKYLLTGIPKALSVGGKFAAITPGGIEERARAFRFGSLYNITPYLVPFTGVTGLPAIGVDSMLNVAISTPQYLEIIKNADDPAQAISDIIPSLLYDVGFALRTRGLPRDYIAKIAMKNNQVQQGLRPPIRDEVYAERILKMQDGMDRAEQQLKEESKIIPIEEKQQSPERVAEIKQQLKDKGIEQIPEGYTKEQWREIPQADRDTILTLESDIKGLEKPTTEGKGIIYIENEVSNLITSNKKGWDLVNARFSPEEITRIEGGELLSKVWGEPKQLTPDTIKLIELANNGDKSAWNKLTQLYPKTDEIWKWIDLQWDILDVGKEQLGKPSSFLPSPDILAQVPKSTGKEPLQDLAVEARKYKTAEEFVRNTPEYLLDSDKVVISNTGLSRDVIEEYKTKIQNDEPIEPVGFSLRDGKYYIYDGNNRATAYKELGIKKIPGGVVSNEAAVKLTDFYNKAVKAEPIEAVPPKLAEIKAINIAKDNPTAKMLRENEIPLGTTQGSKVAHAKYYFTLFRNSIDDILSRTDTVKDVFARSGTLSRIIDFIKPKGVEFQLNDLDAEIIRHQNFVKDSPKKVTTGYESARQELVKLIEKETGIPEEAFSSGATFTRFVNKFSAEEGKAIRDKLPKVANQYFRDINALSINDPEDSGKWLFVQRNSVRGVGTGQGFFSQNGQLKGLGLSPAGKAGLSTAIAKQSEFLNKEGVKLVTGDAFERVAESGEGDFLLIDAPYAEETGYKAGTFSLQDTQRLIKLVQEANQRGAEFTYHDTANPTVIKAWEDAGYRVFTVKVPSASKAGAVKNEIFVISSMAEPTPEQRGFYQKLIGNLPTREGEWGVFPGKTAEKIGQMTVEEIEKGKKIVIEMLKENRDILNKEMKELEADVKGLGGLNPYEFFRGEIRVKGDYIPEELSKIPNKFFNRAGLHIDTLRQALNGMGYNYKSDEELIYALESLKEIKSLSSKDFEEQAKEILEKEDASTEALRNVVYQLLNPRDIAKEKLSALKKEALERTRAVISGRRAKMYEKERVTKLITQIKERLNVSNLKWGYQDIVAELKDSVITQKTTAKERQSLEDFGKFVEGKIAEGEYIYANPQLLKDLGKRSLYEMSEAELRQFNDMVQSVIHQGRHENVLIKSQLSATIDDIARDIQSEILKGEKPPEPVVKTGLREKETVVTNVKQANRELIREERKLERYGQGRDSKYYQTVWVPTNKGFNDYTINKMAVLKRIRAYLGPRLGKVFSPELTREIRPVKINDTLKLTPVQYKMAAIYSLAGDEGLQRLGLGNGISPKDVQDIWKVIQSNPQDKADIDFVMNLIGEYYPRINEIHRNLYGVDMPRKYAYFHFFLDNIEAGLHDAENMTQMLGRPFVSAKALEKGFIKERKGGTAALTLDLWGNLYKSVDMFEKYIGMAEAERDVRKIINHNDVKSALTEQYGRDANRASLQWFKDTYGQKDIQKLTGIDRLFRYLRLRSPAAMIYFNAMVAPRQSSSIFLGISEVGIKDALSGMKDCIEHPMEIQKLVYEKDPIQQFRLVERDIAAIFESQSKTIKGMAGAKSPSELGLLATILVDRKTSNLVWWMSYKSFIRDNASKITDDAELEKKAIDHAQYVVRKTQPAWTSKDLPELFRSSSELSKMVTMFANFPNQIYNYVTSDTFDAYKNGEIGKMELMTHLFWAMGITSMAYGLSRRWRLPTLKEILLDIFLSPLNLVPLGREFSSPIEATILGKPAFGSDGLSLPPFMAISSAKSAITAKKPATKVKYGVRALGYGLGVPGYAQAERSAKGIYDIMRGETNDWRRLFVSEYSLERPDKEEELPLY